MHFNEPVSVKDIMSKEILSAYEGWTIHRLADFFIKHNISAAPVIASDHELVGVVSVGDVFRFQSLENKDKEDALSSYYRDNVGEDINSQDLRDWVKDADKNCTVHQIMTKDVIAVDVDKSLRDVAKILVDHHIHRVFVTDNTRICGVASTLDVLRHLTSVA